jgi:hypothetical protein
MRRQYHFETKCGRKCQREHVVVDHTLDSINATTMIWYCVWGKSHTNQKMVCDKATTKGVELRKWWRFGELCFKHVGFLFLVYDWLVLLLMNLKIDSKSV